MGTPQDSEAVDRIPELKYLISQHPEWLTVTLLEAPTPGTTTIFLVDLEGEFLPYECEVEKFNFPGLP